MTPDSSIPATFNYVSAAGRGRLRFGWFLFVPFVFGFAIVAASHVAAGVSLGLFFAPIILVTCIASPLAMGEECAGTRLAVAGALTLGAWLPWAFTANLSAFDAGRCGLLLFAYICALTGAASFLEFIRLGKTFAASAAVFLGLAWLCWPIWLCPWLGNRSSAQTLVYWFTAAHPLMAMNAILFTRFNFWDRYPLAYQQLTTLNQDILYTLPRTVAWMVGWHLAVGMAGLFMNPLMYWRKTWRKSDS